MSPALDLSLSLACTHSIRVALTVEKVRIVLLHSMVDIGRDTRVELSIPVTDIDEPHGTPSESA